MGFVIVRKVRGTRAEPLADWTGLMKSLELYNIIDIFIVATLLITLILGIWKGFVRSLTALASLVIGVVAAVQYYPAVEPYLGRISSLDPQISMILSMVLIFVAVQAVFVLIRRILAAIIDVTRLGWLDRFLGAVAGVASGFLVVAGVVQIMLLAFPEWQIMKESKLMRPVDQLARLAMEYAPKSAKERTLSFIEQLKGTQEKSSKPKPQSGGTAR